MGEIDNSVYARNVILTTCKDLLCLCSVMVEEFLLCCSMVVMEMTLVWNVLLFVLVLIRPIGLGFFVLFLKKLFLNYFLNGLYTAR